ncbi:MATE family efflux transporter [Sphingomonas sp. MA1305]|uniref:MATE family efflux transporter n=1 Tax=Sphingomonas sp. MA1305 TaxID=2479204 RepID=UPI002FCD22F3
MAGRPPRDLTSGPIGRTLLLFALPTLGSSILQSVNGSINAIWIGQLLGERALAATTNANLVLFLLVAAVFGFGMAATILIGQNMGRRDIDAVRRVFGAALGLFGVASLAVVAIGIAAAPAILHALATPAEVYPLARDYLRIIFLSMPMGFLATLISMALRGTGDSVTPLRFMALGSVIDVTLNPVLIRGLGPIPALGIAGSATATVIGNAVALIALLAFVYRRDLPIRLRGAEWRYLRPTGAELRPIVAKGIPMGLQMFVATGSALAMIGLVNRQGTTTTAAYGAATQLWTYIQMPAMSIGAAVSAMVAQNIGAGRWDRVDRITRSGLLMNLALTGGLVAVVAVLDRHVLWLFLGDVPAAIGIAGKINLIVSWSFILFGVTMVLLATVRANGAVVAPLVILAIALFPVRIGTAYALLPGWGADGLWWSFPAGSIASMVMTIAYYRAGTWRRGRLVSRDEAHEQTLSQSDPAGKQMPVG